MRGSCGESSFLGGILVSQLDVWGGLIAGVLVAVLAVFFQRPRPAVRCARSPTITPRRSRSAFRFRGSGSWSGSSRVSSRLSPATVWGTKLGVQFSITFLALKALPVLIIGGFTSVPGAIVGGLVIGAGEKLAEVYLGPAMGGGIEYWFGFVLALFVLMVRPQGLFGERIIERCRR